MLTNLHYKTHDNYCFKEKFLRFTQIKVKSVKLNPIQNVYNDQLQKQFT